MNILKQYLTRKGFSKEEIELAKIKGKVFIPPNWTNYFVDDEMMFSHRCNHYVKSKTDKTLHSNGYYELVIHVRGDVECIQNNKRFKPSPYCITWCLPGNMHALLPDNGEYERYLMYFSPEFFSHNGKTVPMLGFTQDREVFAANPNEDDIPTLKNLLERAESALESDLVHKNILAKALLVELFAFLNNPNLLVYESESLNDNMGEVKKYIDINYAFLNNITQIADKFYYSREHLSRKFKDRFNISVSEYLSRRRVTESIKLLPQMSISEICYTVGFKSQSVYISSFKKNMGCLPSEYKNYLLKYSKLQ